MQAKCDYKDCKWFKTELFYDPNNIPDPKVWETWHVYWPATCMQCVNLNRDRPNYEKKEEENGT